jgi:hypothetical protein
VDLEAWCLWYKQRGAGRLRRLLMRHWDPIGVAGEPNARDEYDSYLGLVAERLRRGSSADEVARLLQSIRRHEMGLRASYAADLRVANALQAWYAAEMARLRAAVSPRSKTVQVMPE